MGLFDFLTGKKTGEAAQPKTKSPREMARLARLAGDKLAQNYDRQEAIAELGGLGTAEAVQALLRRFDFAMQPSITDQEEKEQVVEGIARAGSAALEPLRTYCAKAESLTWPIRALRRVVADEQIMSELLGILDLFDTDYTRNPEPKIQLIGVLEEWKSPEVLEAVEPFLEDVNESVRFHAVGTVFAMENASSVGALAEVLSREESLRVKNRIAGGLAQRRWELPDPLRKACGEHLPPEFSLRGGVVVRG